MEFRRRQFMEAWRAGSDDLSLPELAPLAAEMAGDPALRAECDMLHDEQHAFRSALHDVAIPAGLAERLMQKLQLTAPIAPSIESPPLLADVDVFGPSAPQAADAPMPASLAVRPINQVRVLLGVATLACALLIPGLLQMFFAAQPLSGEMLVASALDLPAKDVFQGEWRGDIESVPAECSFPSQAFRQDVAPLGWREAEGLVPGATGVVYRLTGPRRAQAYLLVLEVRGGTVGLDVSPAGNPIRSTGGWAAVAWRDGDRVCLLIVEGTADRFRGLLRPEASAT